MPAKSRTHLKIKFFDGERPRGEDFGDFIDSYLSKVNDVDGNENLLLPAGVTLGAPVSGGNGTIRFSGGNLQVFNAGTWNNVGGGGAPGAFQPVFGGPHVGFSGGNVVIGTLAAAPTFKLEVPLGPNTLPADCVKFGNAVISNGQGTAVSSAQFAHADRANSNTDYALRQSPPGELNLNAPATQSIFITHSRTQPRIFIAPNNSPANTGQVVINAAALIPGALPNHMLQVAGNAGKTVGGELWTNLSDVRYKKDVRDFKDGLEKLMQVRPVRFKYSGLPENMTSGNEEVGIIGQEMEEIFPYMISKGSAYDENQTEKKDDVLMYNGSALIYVMVNSIQELTNRVKELETELKETRSSNRKIKK
jgi:hypothetical protein